MWVLAGPCNVGPTSTIICTPVYPAMWLSLLTYIALARRYFSSGNVKESTCSCKEPVVDPGTPVYPAMWLSLLAYIALARQYFSSGNVKENTCSCKEPVVETAAEGELSPNIQGYAEKLYHYAMAVYPSEKISEFRKSVDSVTSTAAALHQAFKGAAEQRGIPLDSLSEELGNMLHALFEELKEQFPPPAEAPGHENRTAMITTILDRIEEIFLQVVINRGMSEEPLRSHSNSLKSGVQHIVVTIGDLYEQHPQLARALWGIAIGTLFAQGILLAALRIIGFGALGPIRGTAAAWLQGWLFGAAVPRGGWFALLQRLAMRGARR